VLTTNAFAQSAKEIRGPSPYVAIEKEPAPVDRGSFASEGWPWVSSGPSTEWKTAHRARVRESALQVSPRVGHLPHNRRRPALVVGGCE
jgi:hypothetical protein